MINQKGFSVVEVLVVVFVVALLGLGGWYIFSKNNDSKKTDTTNKTSQQAKNDETDDAKTSENVVTLKVDNHSLALTVPEILTDLQVASSRDSTFEGKQFTQVTLATDAFKDCATPGGALGTISKLDGTYSTYPFGNLEGTDGVYVKQLDNLMYQAPQSNDCNGTDASETFNKVKRVIVDNNWMHKTN